jgi:uncharacterized protein
VQIASENQSIQSPVQTPEAVQKKKKPLWLGILILPVLVGAYLWSQPLPTSQDPGRKNEETGSILNKLVATPTQMPFAELTVPYLRNREYKSSLGDREVAFQGSNYTAYLTSYDSDGFRVNGLLTIPAGDVPEDGFPAIVFVHGYIPPTLYQTTGQYADYVDYLARNGFVVFKIDLRGHGNSEGEPGGGYYGSDYVVDTLNARAALAASDLTELKKIGLWGHSMAGNVVMRSMAGQPEIKAGVIWAGAVYSYLDWQKYGIDDNSYRPSQTSTQRQNRRQELFERHGSPSASSVFWQQVAPTNYLSDLKGAIEIHHAVDDTVVNIGYSRDLIALLDKTNVPHELFEYDFGGHNITGASFVTAMQRTVDFYKEHLE